MHFDQWIGYASRRYPQLLQPPRFSHPTEPTPDTNKPHSDIAVAAAAAFGLLGMLVGRSLAHNLWLVCGIASAVLAGSLAREEEGGALADVVRAVGFELALKSRQFFFMYRTGRLAYAYNRKVRCA